MLPTFIRTYPPAQPDPGPAYWFPFKDDEMLVQMSEQGNALIRGGPELEALLLATSIEQAPSQTSPLPRAPQSEQGVLYFGTLHGIPCLTCAVAPGIQLPQEWQALTLRALYGHLDDVAYSTAGYASQLIYWQRISRFCPVSGDRTDQLDGGWGKKCPSCGYVSYPPVTPAILALIHDGPRALLAHKPGWGKRYSCIAGFVEPGESLEECVRREIYEEVGVEVADITYVGNQPWPFPHQLMVGFTARYTGGAILLDLLEIDSAAWFRFDQLPELPPPLSLAHHMITSWAHSFTS